METDGISLLWILDAVKHALFEIRWTCWTGWQKIVRSDRIFVLVFKCKEVGPTNFTQGPAHWSFFSKSIYMLYFSWLYFCDFHFITRKWTHLHLHLTHFISFTINETNWQLNGHMVTMVAAPCYGVNTCIINCELVWTKMHLKVGCEFPTMLWDTCSTVHILSLSFFNNKNLVIPRNGLV